MNHFKQISFIICFCFVVNSAWTQTLLGVKGQVNNFGAPLIQEMDLFSKTLGNMINPGFGITLQQRLSPQWAIQIEANYQEERQSYLLSGAESRINTSVLKYIRFPLLAKRNINFGNWSIQAIAGPNFGYGLQLLSGDTSLDYRQSSFKKLDYSDYEVKRFDLGLLLGLGVEKEVSKFFTTALSLRYNIGLTDILKDENNYFFNRGCTLEMAIFFPLQSKLVKE